MMRRSHRISAKVTRAIVSAAILIALPGGQRALAQPMHSRGGQVIVPDSSVEQPNDIGVRAHTNVSYFVPTGGMRGVHPPSLEAGARSGAPANGDYWAETPASLACVYNLASQSNGCNPYAVGAVPAGGSKAIAIVDAYHDATALSDLQMFSTQFGLPAPNLQVIFASGTPPTNSGWNLEEALDTEWAHAMAPNATIYLVEAMSNSLSDLFTAVSKASSLVVAAGGGQVSMSWGTSEFSSETNYDLYFAANKVVYFASAGDSAGVIWPSASPNVVSAGGTANSRVASGASAGNFEGQVAWQSTGGGPSAYEKPPSYQSGLGFSNRVTPDVSAVADPNTPVYVLWNNGWYLVGGTSIAAPVWAGIVNLAGSFALSSKVEQGVIAGGSGVTDIKSGDCGPHESYWVSTGGGYDLCTGLGTPNGTSGK